MIERAMPVSNKVTAGSVAAALATIFWTVAAATFAKNTFNEATIAALTGATTTVLTFVIGWLVPEGASYVKYQYQRFFLSV
jgi:hypothetical protein